MFVHTVKFKAANGKDKEFIEFLRAVVVKVRHNEPDTLMYELHVKVGDPTEIFLYERYKDRETWETHMSLPYIKEVIAKLPNYREGDAEVTQYETVEVK